VIDIKKEGIGNKRRPPTHLGEEEREGGRGTFSNARIGKKTRAKGPESIGGKKRGKTPTIPGKRKEQDARFEMSKKSTGALGRGRYLLLPPEENDNCHNPYKRLQQNEKTEIHPTTGGKKMVRMIRKKITSSFLKWGEHLSVGKGK